MRVRARGDARASVAVGQTVTLDFNDLPFTEQSGQPPYNGYAPLPQSVLTDHFRPVGVVFGREGLSAGVAVFKASYDGNHAVAALDAHGLVPPGDDDHDSGAFAGDTYFRFVTPGTDVPTVADDVVFNVGDAGFDLDVFDIRSYGLDGALVDSQSFSTIAWRRVSLPTAGHRVEVDFHGDLGYWLDDLSFSVVPEPQSLALVAGAALCTARRRRRPCYGCDWLRIRRAPTIRWRRRSRTVTRKSDRERTTRSANATSPISSATPITSSSNHSVGQALTRSAIATAVRRPAEALAACAGVTRSKGMIRRRYRPQAAPARERRNRPTPAAMRAARGRMTSSARATTRR